MRIEYGPCYKTLNGVVCLLGHIHRSYNSALEEVNKLIEEETLHYGQPITEIFVGKHISYHWRRV